MFGKLNRFDFSPCKASAPAPIKTILKLPKTIFNWHCFISDIALDQLLRWYLILLDEHIILDEHYSDNYAC